MKTNVYGNFNFFKENRILNQGLIKRLINSIQKIGYAPGKPILINKNWQIVDGQHRFEACKQLGLPIYYEFMTNGNDMESIIELNRNQLIWRLDDFINSYAKQGKNEYQYLKKIEDEYHLGISNTILIVGDNKLSAQKIRNGDTFIINPFNIEIIEYLLSFKELDFYLNLHFTRAIVSTWAKTTQLQRAKIHRNRMLIQQVATVVGYLTIFENIINKRAQDHNKVKLSKF